MITVTNLAIQFGKRVLYKDVNMPTTATLNVYSLNPSKDLSSVIETSI